MIGKYLLLISLLVASGVRGQGTVIHFGATLGGLPLHPSGEDQTGAAAGAELWVETLRYYVSGIRLLRGGVPVHTEPDSYHLIDAAVPESQSVHLATPAGLVWDELGFRLGVDSSKSTAGVFAGDLDPTKGMYWTWRSGYIHFKLEGRAAACPARGHRFQFHVGGVQAPFSTVREVTLPKGRSADLTVILELEKLLVTRELATHYRIMSPGAAAVAFADLLAGQFTTQTPAP